MTNLEQEIKTYVSSKRDSWSDRTLPVVRTVLTTLAPHFNSPYRNYKELIKKGLKKHTIRNYFLYAIGFEEESLGTTRYREYLKRNRTTFKNCYKDKTRILKPAEFQNALRVYKDKNIKMYNLLILMGTAGLRISEAMGATWEDIQDGFLTIIGKVSKQRSIPFDSSRLLGENKTGSIVGTLSYRFLFDRDLAPFTPHDFRAFYATMIANHPELSIKDAALLLGHSSITTTSRYVRSDLDRIAKVLNAPKITVPQD